jgi:hypothetical protein
MFASEIGNYMKGSNRSMKEHTVELGKNICASFVARNYNKRTEVASLHLPVERLLDRGIPHKDEVTENKFVVLHGMSVVEFEVSCSFASCFIYLVVEIGEVFAAFLKCYSAISDEVGC